MSNFKFLSDEDVSKLIDNWNESEDELDISDDEDPDYYPEHMVRIEDEFLNEDESTTIEPDEPSIVASASSSDANIHPNNGHNKCHPKVIWKKQCLQLTEEEMEFTGNTALPEAVSEMDTPYQFFKFFFDDDIIDNIVNETNRYSIQKDPSNTSNTITALDIRQFIGVVLYMSVVHMPNVRFYWSNKIGLPLIKETMSQRKFEKIRQILHFNNNDNMIPFSEPNSDRIFKIRPLVNGLNKNFQKIPVEQFLSVDEQMCSCKARSFIKQYMPMKPSKWGFKLFVLCSSTGFAYNMEIYTGQENVTLPSEPNMGASANVFVRLARIIPRNKNYRLYFDNYYTCLPLLEYLYKERTSLGTIRRNRIVNNKFPGEKGMKKLHAVLPWNMSLAIMMSAYQQLLGRIIRR